MKKLYKICLSLALVVGLNSTLWAQTGDKALLLGTSKSVMSSLKETVGKESDKGTTIVDLVVTGNKKFKAKVNFKQSDANSEYLVGEIDKVKGSSFYLRATDKGLEGHILLKESDEAFKYYSDANGNAYVKEVDLHDLICINFSDKNAPKKEKSEEGMVSEAMPNLQSLPGAAGCVLLDFDGYFMPAGNLWNNGNSINAAHSGMSDAAITESWEIVAEDFRPFNLNITTNEAVFNSYPRNRRMRCVITPTNTAAPGAGGVAYIGSFNWNNDVPCWTFITSAKGSAEASSHEIGHTFGLGHDGRTSPSEGYFQGHGDWAPIMGVGYYRPITQWSRGEYAYANNTEDDLAKIASATYGVGYRNDDHGNNTSNASTLTYNSSGVVSNAQNRGVIERTGDLDFFTFTTSGGNVSLNVNTVSRHGNLDILVRLYNSSGSQIGSYNPGGLNATVNANLAAGRYYLSVTGTGAGNAATNGYSNYASLGSYFISGNIPPGSGVTGVATVYKDCNYGGYAVGLPVGDYNLSQLIGRGVLNDDISSLRVNNGYEVLLYEHDNFTGASIVIRGENSCLVAQGWNDRASSLRVRSVSPSFSRFIEAENYSAMLGVQTEACSEGGLNVGWIDTGDWMAYNSINFPSTGTYRVEYRVASLNGGGRLSLDLNAGSIQLGALNVPSTGGWQNWTTISHTVNVNAGTYNLGIYSQNGGWNLNWIRITAVSSGAAALMTESEEEDSKNITSNYAANVIGGSDNFEVFPNPVQYDMTIQSHYNLQGSSVSIMDVMGREVMFIPELSSSINVSGLDAGIYTITIITADNQKMTQRFMKRY